MYDQGSGGAGYVKWVSVPRRLLITYANIKADTLLRFDLLSGNGEPRKGWEWIA